MVHRFLLINMQVDYEIFRGALGVSSVTSQVVTMRLIVVVFLVLMYTGCATKDFKQRLRPSEPLPASTRPTYNLAGYPSAFKDGYIDGCETAKKTSYGFKNKHRFSKDNQYRMGWNDGFNMCLSK